LKAREAPWFSVLPVAGDTPLALNADLDLTGLAAAFAAHQRLQVRNCLAVQTADRLRLCLEREVSWGLAYVRDGAPQFLSKAHMATLSPLEQQALIQESHGRAARGEYQYLYRCYPLLQAYLENWEPDLYLNRWLEFLNSEGMLGFVRAITGFDDLIKADGQASLYGPNMFLNTHDDSHVGQGWRVAYVMNFARNWRENFGGSLLFHDAEGDTVAGFLPRFNALNLFAVPQRHSVNVVAAYAPIDRFAITGWFRNR
jgi:SM-20-related protein